MNIYNLPVIFLALILALTELSGDVIADKNMNEDQGPIITVSQPELSKNYIPESIQKDFDIEGLTCVDPIPESPRVSLSKSDIELIALITMGEAEAESEYGKRLVIDTILNRVEHSSFPNSIHDVVYQSGQYICVFNGRLKRCSVKEDICKLVREEAANRSNGEVIFFTAGGYGKYGKRLFQEGHHYFCSF